MLVVIIPVEIAGGKTNTVHVFLKNKTNFIMEQHTENVYNLNKINISQGV